MHNSDKKSMINIGTIIDTSFYLSWCCWCQLRISASQYFNESNQMETHSNGWYAPTLSCQQAFDPIYSM